MPSTKNAIGRRCRAQVTCRVLVEPRLMEGIGQTKRRATAKGLGRTKNEGANAAALWRPTSARTAALEAMLSFWGIIHDGFWRKKKSFPAKLQNPCGMLRCVSRSMLLCNVGSSASNRHRCGLSYLGLRSLCSNVPGERGQVVAKLIAASGLCSRRDAVR